MITYREGNNLRNPEKSESMQHAGDCEGKKNTAGRSCFPTIKTSTEDRDILGATTEAKQKKKTIQDKVCHHQQI